MLIEDVSFSKHIKKITWFLEDVKFMPYLVVTGTTFYSYVDIVDKQTYELITRVHIHPNNLNYNTSPIADLYAGALSMQSQAIAEFTPIIKLRVPYRTGIKGSITKLLLKGLNCIMYRTCKYIPSPVSNTILQN